MNRASFRFVWVALVGSLQTMTAQPVVNYVGEGSLLQRWAWAVKEASTQSQKEFWIVYSIKRLMDEDSYVATGSYFSGVISSAKSLYSQMSISDSTEEDSKIAAKRGLRRTHSSRGSIEKRLKDVAFIFKQSDGKIASVDVNSMELDFSLKRLPAYWLGVAGTDESLAKLRAILPNLAEVKQRRNAVQAAGLHQTSSVAPFLTEILESDEQPEVRAEAAEWLGEQNTNDILPVLEKHAAGATTERLIEACVYAISRVESNESTELIIKLAKSGKNSRLRKKAAFWLGQKATLKSQATLSDLLENDPDTDVQRQALYAIAQGKDDEVTDRLIRVAHTHPRSSIRKQAIYLLSDKAERDERALDALIDLTKK